MWRSRCRGFAHWPPRSIWTRILSLLFGASTYTFSLILAVFLIGLGIGSSLGSIIAKGVERPRVALGWCQLLNVGAMAWSAYMLMTSLPYWPINTSITTSIWYNFQLDFVRAFWAVLPGPILWGASFPLALAAVARARRGSRPARRRRVCRQHRRRDLRFGRREPRPRVLVRLAARAAGADDRVGHVRPAVARASRAELGDRAERTLRWLAPAALVDRAWPGRLPHSEPSRRFPASWSPTDDTPRRGSGRRATSSTSARGSARRSPSRASARS